MIFVREGKSDVNGSFGNCINDLVGLTGRHRIRYARVVSGKLAQNFRHQSQRGGVDDHQLDVPASGRTDVVHDRAKLFKIVQGLPAMFHDNGTCGSQDHAVGRAVQELDAQIPFNVLQLPRNRRRAHIEDGRRLADRPLTRNGVKIPEELRMDHADIRFHPPMQKMHRHAAYTKNYALLASLMSMVARKRPPEKRGSHDGEFAGHD